MFEELLAPIPDVDAYLARLEMERPEKLDVEYLDRLVFAHQSHIPFENLTSWLTGSSTGLVIDDLFQKMIVNKRGGFCFELNGLFCGLLQALGYDAYSVRVRLLRPGVEPEHNMYVHRGIVVNVDGQPHYVDVGFGGPSSAGAVPVKEGMKKEAYGDTFFIRAYDQNWWQQYKLQRDGEEQPILQFMLLPESPVAFTAPNYYCGSNPASLFTQKPNLNLRTAVGNISLNGERFVIRENGQIVQDVAVTTKEDVLAYAAQYFGIAYK